MSFSVFCFVVFSGCVFERLFIVFVVSGVAAGCTFGVFLEEVAFFIGKGGTLVFDRRSKVFACFSVSGLPGIATNPEKKGLRNYV